MQAFNDINGDSVNIALFEKPGFVKEGVKRQEVYHEGRFLEEIHYGLLADEFNKSKM
jgi:RimJ/RimL family protein N-acetyltransferase